MIKYSLCIEPLFPEVDFYDRIPLAADLGFQAVEFWDPDGKDLKRIARLASQNGLVVATCCLHESWKVRLNAPASMVTEIICQSIDIAQELGCSSLIGLTGDLEPAGAAQKETLIDNLKFAADHLSQAGITLNLEALNSWVDHPGYYLDSSKTGFEIVRAVGCDQVRLLYDIYHMQVMEGDLIATIRQNIAWIGHFHSAGVPGRHEHFIGEIHYPNVVDAIIEAGYDRFLGLEYWPTYDHQRSAGDVLAYLTQTN